MLKPAWLWWSFGSSRLSRCLVSSTATQSRQFRSTSPVSTCLLVLCVVFKAFARHLTPLVSSFPSAISPKGFFRKSCHILVNDRARFAFVPLFVSPSLQFDPAPRRGEPHVTRRTPDYFLWFCGITLHGRWVIRRLKSDRALLLWSLLAFC